MIKVAIMTQIISHSTAVKVILVRWSWRFRHSLRGRKSGLQVRSILICYRKHSHQPTSTLIVFNKN